MPVWLADAWRRRAPWLYLLWPLERLFRLAVLLRRSAYSRGLLASVHPGKPVVVVGNLSVGGSGKTPVVIALAQAMLERGLRPGMLARGYGAAASSMPYSVGDASTVADCGDEALLIYRRTGCPCVVATSRVAAARALLREYDVDLLISDDGLQHYALARDMEVVMVDAGSGFANGLCLPAGPLREPPGRAAEADFVLHRGDPDPDNGVRYQAEALVNLATGEQRAAVAGSIGASVYAVAGLGQPGYFLSMLAELGFNIEPHLFPDHHAFSPADLAGLADSPIIMTEKDAVKCAGFAGEDAWYLQVSACLPEKVTEAVAALAPPPFSPKPATE